MKVILALDQGTTSSRAILFDRAGRMAGLAQREITQRYPRAGWVEHDALEIWERQIEVARQVLAQSGTQPADVAAIGIANQRETTVVWDLQTGIPVCNAIVWQCRRTAAICEALTAQGWADKIRFRTGLPLDAYFSGTKLKWILDQIPGVRARALQGDLLFGTVDTWLIWKLTRGRVHATDYSNASRTLLYNIRELRWDAEILTALEIPDGMLPQVRPSSGLYGVTEPGLFGGVGIPIAGTAGDQQAALFGQTCFEAGGAKNTYGTGCFLLLNTGAQPTTSRHGLLTTLAWGIDGRVDYALEGSVFTAGAVVQWLRDEMHLIATAAQTEDDANRVPDTQGVYVVPAFTGMGAPYWDMHARGAIVGLTRGARREHVVRAALESIAYQTRDVIDAMQEDSGGVLKHLQADGGAAANAFLMQFQADILGIPVRTPEIMETTALGAAYLAGLAVGFWRNQAELREHAQVGREFRPAMSEARRRLLYEGWQRAVRQTLGQKV
jgi:glycerol kinase